MVVLMAYCIDGEIYCDDCGVLGAASEEELNEDYYPPMNEVTDSFIRCGNCGSLEGDRLTDQGWIYETISLCDNLIREPKGFQDLLTETNLRYWTEVEGGCWSCPGAAWGDVVSEALGKLRENTPTGFRWADECDRLLEGLEESIDDLAGWSVCDRDLLDIYISATWLKSLVETLDVRRMA
jgi:hypothetical protein